MNLGYKVFVSYKYKDSNVAPLNGYHKGTARDYVDYLQDTKFSGDDLNKAEKDGEDLSEFKDETIRTKLKEMIWDSSVTLVFISSNMVEKHKVEDNQWIPWEIAYSLRTQTKLNRRSLPNAVIAVVLPDKVNSYEYFITHWTYKVQNDQQEKRVNSIHTYNSFQIIARNMFNQKIPSIKHINGKDVYCGDCSYIDTVKWKNFILDVDGYLEHAISLRDNIDNYNVCKKT